MLMNKDNAIVEAKGEYTRELVSLLTDPVIEKLDAMYNSSVASTNKSRDVLITFQKMLRDVPLWNQACIETEVTKIVTRCDWLGDLISAVFISNVKILTSVKIGKDKKKIQITMPKTDQFIHKVYINSAKAAYENPYIFLNAHKRPELRLMVKICIEDTIRNLLPFQNILQSYLGNIHDELPSDEDNDNDSVVSDIEDFPDIPSDDTELEQFPPPPSPVAPLAPLAPPTNNNGFFDEPSEPQIKSVEIPPRNHAADLLPDTSDIPTLPSVEEPIRSSQVPPTLFEDAVDDFE